MAVSPTLSIIVPAHNEERILRGQLENMLAAVRALELPFEILVVENGSSDGTAAEAQAIAAQAREVRVMQLPVGNYGNALRQGIRDARNDIVIIFNADFWNVEFIQKALAFLPTCTIVIGSKRAKGARDERPIIRRLITRIYTWLLRWAWGFTGTDTHGMKAFWRESILPIVMSCVTNEDIFDSELVLRAERAGLGRIEVPTDVRELRQPSFKSLTRRVPRTIRSLWRLWWTLRAQDVPAEVYGVTSRTSGV